MNAISSLKNVINLWSNAVCWHVSMYARLIYVCAIMHTRNVFFDNIYMLTHAVMHIKSPVCRD